MFHSARCVGGSVGKQCSVPAPKPTFVMVQIPLPPLASTSVLARSRTSISVWPAEASLVTISATLIARRWARTRPSGGSLVRLAG